MNTETLYLVTNDRYGNHCEPVTLEQLREQMRDVFNESIELDGKNILTEEREILATEVDPTED
jgi:hypothetical protein